MRTHDTLGGGRTGQPEALPANGLKPIRARRTTRSPTDACRATADSGMMTGGAQA